MIILQTRIFADHYQFYIHDAKYEHYDAPELNWSTANKLKYGYIATEKAVYISTKSDLNDHCIKLILNEVANQEDYETYFTNTIQITSGKLQLSSPSSDYDDGIVSIEKGVYVISICGKNIGKDMFSYKEEFDEEMSDKEYCDLNKFESYDIFINKA